MSIDSGAGQRPHSAHRPPGQRAHAVQDAALVALLCIIVGVLGMAWGAASARASHAQHLAEILAQHAAQTAALESAVASATARVDTVHVTIERVRRRVDTAWAAVPESIYVAVPEVAEARDACTALALVCAEARVAHEAEREHWRALRAADLTALASVRAALDDAQRRAARQQTAARWRGRLEGAAVVVAGGLAVQSVQSMTPR